MIEIDGSQKSGSGTILRYAVSLSGLTGQPLHIRNIRAKRDKPGLRPQHLKSVLATAELTDARVDGAELGSKELRFQPNNTIKSGQFCWDIGTAGSTTMLAMTILPLLCFANKESTVTIKGGLFQDFAPSAFHMQHVLFPLLKDMGIEAHLKIIKPGYVPKGSGEIELTIKPIKDKIKPIKLINQGKPINIKGFALSSHLAKRQVSHRMADACKKFLKEAGFYNSDIEIIYDNASVQRGAALAIYAITDTGCAIGSDMAGKIGRSSEYIGEFVANAILEDINSGATVDRHIADQLIIYAALASGRTEYLMPRMTEHIESNLWLIEKMLATKTKIIDNRIVIEGIGFRRQKS